MLLLVLLVALIPSLLALVAILSLFLYIALYRASTTTRRTSLGRSAAVIVLGDVGRSPRMCYHVESLADEGWRVAVVGYGGSDLPRSIQRSSVRFHQLKPLPSCVAKLPRAAFIAVAPFKLLWQSASLFWKVTMTIQPAPELIFVQTPPALPTLLVIRVCSMLLSSRVIIDWHNLGYSLLALRLGAASPIVSLARTLERLSGRTAFAHLFVTHAMKRHMEVNWQLKGHMEVLHDRPPKHFRKALISETHQLWRSLAPRLAPDLKDFWPAESGPAGTSTPFTAHDSATGNTILKGDRPAIVVSSTSWTADEDFGMLLRAAQLYEKRAKEIHGRNNVNATISGNSFDQRGLSDSPRASQDLQYPQSSSSRRTSMLDVRRPIGPSSEQPPSPSRASHRSRRPSWQSQRSFTLPNTPADRLPKLLIVVTGKGELRSWYEKEIARLETQEAWKFVRIRTVWLENWEYPLLLGSADLGISLHTSSSGLDLPMKVVDMLGCHLPVLALDFSCLDELLQHGYNGLKFSDEEQLVEGLESLLADFPHESANSGRSSGETAANWLVKGGGLKEPFSLAGRSVEKDHSSAVGSRNDTNALKTVEEGTSDAYRLTFPILDFSKGGLPTTSTFASQSLPSSISLEAYDGRLVSRPMTPTPSFTMIPSPILSSLPLGSMRGEFPALDDSYNGATDNCRQAQKGNTTWASKWKATMRPLLRLADEEDARAEGGSLSDEEAEAAADLASAADSYEYGHDQSRGQGSLLGEVGARSHTSRFPLSHSGPALSCAKDSIIFTPQKRRGRLGLDGRPLRVRGGSVHGLLWGLDYSGSPPMEQGSSAECLQGEESGQDAGQAGAEGEDQDSRLDEIQVGLLGNIHTRSLVSASPMKSRSIAQRFGLSFLKQTEQQQQQLKKKKDGDDDDDDGQARDDDIDSTPLNGSDGLGLSTATEVGSGLGLDFDPSNPAAAATATATGPRLMGGEVSRRQAGLISSGPSMARMQPSLRYRTVAGRNQSGNDITPIPRSTSGGGEIPDICVSEVESGSAGAARPPPTTTTTGGLT